MIGRDYNSKQAIRAIECLKSAGFDTLNADLIFAIENQTMQELESDLRTAIDLGLDQITCYPLFTFPYSEIGELRRLKRVKVPGRAVRKEMYYFTHDFMLQQAFTRTSVWSFNRQEKERYSSVTRDYYLDLVQVRILQRQVLLFQYLFGTGLHQSARKDLPVSLKMDVSPRMERSFWLYWRLYETELDKRKYSQFFYRDIETDYRALLALFRLVA
jgi:oxygen-independent coproporphyrinogen-3 oxidase